LSAKPKQRKRSSTMLLTPTTGSAKSRSTLRDCARLASVASNWGSRSTGGPLACNQQMRVRFPPLPPISPGRPLRSRRRSEKPDKHVRLVLLAPSVTVAEWLRRQTVDLSTRVQFPPVTPTMRASFNGENTSALPKKCRFDSGRLFQCFVSVAQLDESAGFRSPRPLVRFQPLTPDL
jgi:hypothetical protein